MGKTFKNYKTRKPERFKGRNFSREAEDVENFKQESGRFQRQFQGGKNGFYNSNGSFFEEK